MFSFGDFTVVLHKLHTDVLQMCTQMLCTCADVFWSHSGLTRSRDRGEGDACLKSKMATGKLKFLLLFFLEIWDLSQILLELYHK